MDVKTCTKCGETKAIDEFRVRGDTGRRQSYCKKCMCQRTAAWKKENRERKREANNSWRRNNPDKQKELIAKSIAKRPLHYRVKNRERALRGRYGIDIATFDRWSELQNWQCAICHEGTENLHVDHCHESGVVRGLLCGKCNKMLGFARDNQATLLRAISYLATASEHTAGYRSMDIGQ